MLIAQARERINFKGGSTSFRRVLQRMGFSGYKTLSQKTPTNQSQGMSQKGGRRKNMHANKSSSGATRVRQHSQIDTDDSHSSSSAKGGIKKKSIKGENIKSSKNEENSTTVTVNSSNTLILPQTQTVHILQSDNTLQPVQVLYTTTIQ